jgi:hypothetical protein
VRHREKILVWTLDKFIICHAGQAFNPSVADRLLQFLLSSVVQDVKEESNVSSMLKRMTSNLQV